MPCSSSTRLRPTSARPSLRITCCTTATTCWWAGFDHTSICLPILKRNTHQEALLDAATSGSEKFFLGTDSAPHAQHAKEAACGCAGCYTAYAAIEMYAEAFEQRNALDKLEAFASLYGPRFYGLPANTDRITLVRDEWTAPTQPAIWRADRYPAARR